MSRHFHLSDLASEPIAIPGKSPVPRKGPRSAPPGPVGACISENARASGNSYLHGRQRPPETPPCARLSAGGNGLRTLGPPRERVRLSHKNVSPERRTGQSRGALSILGDRGQESSACRSGEFFVAPATRSRLVRYVKTLSEHRYGRWVFRPLLEANQAAVLLPAPSISSIHLNPIQVE